MQLKDVYSKSTEEILKELSATPEGLTSNEAEKRNRQYGLNLLRPKERFAKLKILLRQGKNSLFYILLLAAIFSYFLGTINDAIIISAVLVINTALGFYEENKSQKTFERLQKFLEREVTVRRNGILSRVEEKKLTPGDIVSLKEGDLVPADIRLLSAQDLSVNESTFSGESQLINKVVIDSRSPKETLLFAGTIIEKGDAEGIVFNIGEKTELGRIASLSFATTKISQYQQSLNQFSSSLVKIVLLLIIIIFALKLTFNFNGLNIFSISMFVVALAIAVVPEALPVIATVTLASGVMKLAKNHCVVKSLAAAEDLGNVTVLCTDKTGTLTENKMVVTSLTADDETFLKNIAYAAAKTSGALKTRNSFDEAILNYLAGKSDLNNDFQLIKEVPFDPASRRNWAVIKNNHDFFLISIGSVETLLEFSQSENKTKYLSLIRDDGLKGLRHFGYSFRKINYSPEMDLIKEEKEMTFLGFFTFEDPLKPHAADTVKLAQGLGVKIKILSGDSFEVTQFIAQKVGLLENDEKVWMGEEIEKLTDNELEKIVPTAPAFARVSPEQKFRIIRLLKKNNVVAYQGDGINDAPALKLADVSIAVQSATDIAKENADIVLLRKDIGVIISGIKNGRQIFSNINKYIRYTMVGNFGNFFALSLLFIFARELPLTPVQLLLTSLLTDIPLIAIATDNVAHEELMKPSHYDIKRLMRSSLILGVITTLFLLLFSFICQSFDAQFSQTALFFFFTLAQLLVIFSVRTSDYFCNTFKLSWPLTLGIISTFAVLILIIYFPILSPHFSLQSLPLTIILVALILAFVYLIVLDSTKVWLYRRFSK